MALTLTNPKYNKVYYHNERSPNPVTPWFEHRTDMTLPGPGQASPKDVRDVEWISKQSQTGPRWARAHRNHPVDNLKEKGMTGVETPGPGAHNPRHPLPQLHSMRMVPRVAVSKNARLKPITPGPSCYDVGVDNTHAAAPRGFMARAGRRDLWELPAPGETSVGPPAMTMAELLRPRKKKVKKKAWATPQAGVVAPDANGTFSREERFISKLGMLRGS